MFVKIPFESEIPFKTNISEVTKMSLEHDFNVNDEVVLGNFYISGEYRSHELSVNVDPFNYTLPFSVNYPDNLIQDSLEFNIEDFSYEIIKNNTLKVNIEYSLKGELKSDELFERVDEKELESELAFIDDFIDRDYEIDIEEDENVENDEEVDELDEDEEEILELPKFVEEVKKEEKEYIEDKIEVVTKKNEEVKVEIKNEEVDDRLTEKEEKTIMETIKNSDDTFVTYHVHIMKESESLESICALYSVPSSLISEYNNIESITMGDKILIPKIDE